jgi:hypothetical protein
MNINRKIQLTAACVIANGALALGLLAAGPALATTCGTTMKVICVASGVCQNQENLTAQCQGAAAPGCVAIFGDNHCLPDGCGGSDVEAVCEYMSS